MSTKKNIDRRCFFFRCTVMNVTGFTSPHKDDVIETNDHCDPTKTSYVEFSDCGGAVLDEQPGKMAESVRLFLQGLGHSTLTLFFFLSFRSFLSSSSIKL